MTLMEHRLTIMMGTNPDCTPLYQKLRHLLTHMTREDFDDAIAKMRTWQGTPQFERELANAFGDQADRAAEMLRLRIDCLEEILDSKFTLMPALPSPPTAGLFHPPSVVGLPIAA
jgi:hypothetical protein